MCNFIYFLTFGIFQIIGLCSSACSMVNSVKHGKLFLKKSEEFHPNCVGNLIFQKEETGKIFCLKRNIILTDKITCVGTAAQDCFCGQENKPSMGLETIGVGKYDKSGMDLPAIVGGDEVGKNQYPWHALVLTLLGKENIFYSYTFISILTKKLTN